MSELAKYIVSLGKAPNYDIHHRDIILFKNCLEEVKKRMMINIIKMDVQNGDLLKDFKKIQDSTLEKNKEIKADKRNDRYIFLTINPPPKTKISDMRKCIERAIKRPFIKTYHYVYEQRGTDVKTTGKGKHIHLLFERDINYKPSKIYKYLKNTFKSLYGSHKITEHNFNFKKCGHEYYLARLKYIKGNKTEDGKDKKCKVDFIWRKLNKLQKIYES